MKSWYKSSGVKSRTFHEVTKSLKIIDDLDVLRRIPLSMLALNADALPPESIRFFFIDENFVSALKDGALSIGRNAGTMMTAPQKTVDGCRTGMLLRSVAVKIWKDMEIYASKNDGTVVNILRRDNLGGDIMICLFGGEFDTLTFTEPEHSRHFGFEYDDKNNPTINLTNLQGKKIGDAAPVFRSKGVLDVCKTIDAIQSICHFNPLTSLEFAAEMLFKPASVSLKVYWGGTQK